MGPWAGLHLTVTLWSFTSITSISEGELTPDKEDESGERNVKNATVGFLPLGGGGGGSHLSCE